MLCCASVGSYSICRCAEVGVCNLRCIGVLDDGLLCSPAAVGYNNLRCFAVAGKSLLRCAKDIFDSEAVNWLHRTVIIESSFAA